VSAQLRGTERSQMDNEGYPFRTLGQRLDEQARRLAARRLPAYPWARPLARFLDHLTSLPAPVEGRFQRIEAQVHHASLQGRGTAGELAAPAIYAQAVIAGRPLAPEVQARLRQVVGPGVEALRVHDDEMADATARGHQADAVTVGPDVFFRQSQFQPHEPRGFGLLAHEATHVVALLHPGVSWQRATGAGVREEEATAQAHESSAVSAQPAPSRTPGMQPIARFSSAIGPASTAARSSASISSVAASMPPPSTPALQPMRAATDRKSEPASPVAAPFDVEEMRRTLMRDLMRQLRTEFERGG
jgi:hypothetical protein